MRRKLTHSDQTSFRVSLYSVRAAHILGYGHKLNPLDAHTSTISSIYYTLELMNFIFVGRSVWCNTYRVAGRCAKGARQRNNIDTIIRFGLDRRQDLHTVACTSILIIAAIPFDAMTTILFHSKKASKANQITAGFVKTGKLDG